MLNALQVLAVDPETRFILPDKYELVWGSIAFVLLFVLLAWKGFPKLKQTMAARTEKIRSSLEDAEGAKKEADTVLEQYRAQLADARNEANRIIEESKKTAEALRRELVARAEAEAGEIVARARTEVGAERDRAMAELRSTVGEMTIQIAAKVLGRELSNEAAQRAFVDQTIAELSRLGSAGGGNGRN